MIGSDDVKRLLQREGALSDDVKRRDSDPSLSSPSLLAATTNLISYPTKIQCYYACQPLTLLGAEVEGGPGVMSTEYSTFFALNLGSKIPPVGTQVLTTFIASRWVFRYDG
ncbi:MAG: hypothetical protein NVSMB9_01420 [Isosphaeraceae bacterium]